MNYLRISVVDNGYVLHFDDPKIRERNRKEDNWTDPERQRIYDTPEALVADLQKLLPLLQATPPAEEDVYEDAITEAFNKVERN